MTRNYIGVAANRTKSFHCLQGGRPDQAEQKVGEAVEGLKRQAMYQAYYNQRKSSQRNTAAAEVVVDNAAVDVEVAAVVDIAAVAVAVDVEGVVVVLVDIAAVDAEVAADVDIAAVVMVVVVDDDTAAVDTEVAVVVAVQKFPWVLEQTRGPVLTHQCFLQCVGQQVSYPPLP